MACGSVTLPYNHSLWVQNFQYGGYCQRFLLMAADVELNPGLLIKFYHWDKEMQLFKGREDLRRADIRIGDDLMSRQRQTLKRWAEKGY